MVRHSFAINILVLWHWENQQFKAKFYRCFEYTSCEYEYEYEFTDYEYEYEYKYHQQLKF